MSILRFFGFFSSAPASAPSAETQTVRKIMTSLDAMEPEQARFVAAFAYVLCRVARTDLHISDEEAAAMERIVTEHAGLTEDQAIVVLQIAKTQELLFGSTENFLVTREFNRLASREQKLALLECLFAVSSADDSISTLEDNEIVRICAELQLPREDLLAARGRYREHLEVLKGMPRA